MGRSAGRSGSGGRIGGGERVKIIVNDGETPLKALLRVQGESLAFFEWDESELVPCSPEEARDGLRAAVAEAREKGWIPQEDPGCECGVCRSFRAYIGEKRGGSMNTLFNAVYHVPRSQVWEASAGRESGCVHLHVREQFDFGRIHRTLGQALCGKRGWYEREADDDERLCPRCKSIVDRWAEVQSCPKGFRTQIVVSGGEARALLIPEGRRRRG
jgi:hypothetical protein